MAEGSRSSLYFSEETDWNEAPSSPLMEEVQITSRTGGRHALEMVSAIVRDDRMQDKVFRVGEQGEASFNFELRSCQYDVLFGAFLGANGFRNAPSLRGLTDISVSSVGNTFTTAGSVDFLVAGVISNMWVRTRGFANAGNNGLFFITNVTSTVITVADPGNVLVTESAGATVFFILNMVRNGISNRSFFFERRHEDLGIFEQLRGMRPDKMTLDLQSRDVIKGTMSFVGGETYLSFVSAAGSSTLAEVKDIFDGCNSVLFIEEGGITLTTPVLGMTLNIDNSANVQPVVGQKLPIGVRRGAFAVNGMIDVYFENLTLATKFFNHASTSLRCFIGSPNEEPLIITVPHFHFTEGTLPISGVNTDIILSLPWHASIDPVENYSLQMDLFCNAHEVMNALLVYIENWERTVFLTANLQYTEDWERTVFVGTPVLQYVEDWET